MDIINLERIREFTKYHPRASASFRHWEAIVNDSSWKTFQDVRDTFRSADYVDGKVVFDIGGNNYRLIAVIDYLEQQVIIRHVMNHREYNRRKWKQWKH